MGHADILLSYMNGLFAERVDCDVVLSASQDVQVHVHKVVLTAYSHYFAHRFSGKNNVRTSQTKWIDLKNVSGVALMGVIECIYTGRLTASKPDEVHLMLTVARQLQVSAVINICQEALRTNEANDGNVEWFKNESLPVFIKSEGCSEIEPSIRDSNDQRVFSKANRTYEEDENVDDTFSSINKNCFSPADELVRADNYSDDIELAEEMRFIQLDNIGVHKSSLGVTTAEESVNKRVSRKRSVKPPARVCHRKTEQRNGEIIKCKVVNKSKAKCNTRSSGTIIDKEKEIQTTIASKIKDTASKIKDKKKCDAKRKIVVKIEPSDQISDEKIEDDVSNTIRKRGRKRKLKINEMESKNNAVDTSINENHITMKKPKLLKKNLAKIKEVLATDLYCDSIESAKLYQKNDAVRNYARESRQSQAREGILSDSREGVQSNAREGVQSELSNCVQLDLNTSNILYSDTLCSDNSDDKLSLDLNSTTMPNINSKIGLSDSTVVRQKVGRWVCREAGCELRLTSSETLKRHMTELHPNVMYSCKQCKYHTLFRRLMEKHDRLRHHDVLDKTCDLCKKEFSSKYFYKVHLRMKHDVIDPTLKVFECTVEGCKFFSPHISNLKKHEIKHQIDKPFCCDFCGKRIKTEQNLAKHRAKMHLGIRPHICEQCGAGYGEEAELKAHIARHSDVKIFNCKICGLGSMDKGNFKSHMWAKHKVSLTENQRVYSCTICEYTTDRHTRYNQHMDSHANRRRHACPKCSKSFTSRQTLKGHIEWVHEFRLLRCDFCDHVTRAIGQLREHVRCMHTHRDVKPYKCAYCEFRCSMSGNCRKHVAQCHKGQPIKWVKVCDKYPDNDRQILGIDSFQTKSTVAILSTKVI